MSYDEQNLRYDLLNNYIEFFVPIEAEVNNMIRKSM